MWFCEWLYELWAQTQATCLSGLGMELQVAPASVDFEAQLFFKRESA